MAKAMPKVDEIFLAALEKSTAEDRAAYLDEVCAGDAHLRQRLDQLLDAHQQAGKFMEHPAVNVAPTLPMQEISERPGTVIGRYKLLQDIGEGGFGVVFMAEQQEPMVRKVAIKVIKPGMDTKEVIARFEAERQALALMDHPNIARVFDAGCTETGRPYFVMELVKGIPITEYCEQNNLTVPERLTLFVSVCHAVQHAHQKGIIHRDLKPSNILVSLHDDTPTVKVIDFGVAKALSQRLTDRTLFTKYAQVIGTPLYMSPEQALLNSLDVDTRSDIYSLGVLLYELLTGSTPFDRARLSAAVLDEIRRIIREEEPPKPSTRISGLGHTATDVARHRKTDPNRLSVLLRGDLDWIVMKALEKDRTCRYDTAKDFAADVIRHMQHQPVEAGPPSVIYRFRKFARRYKTQLAMITSLSIVLIVASIVSLCLAAWALRAEETAHRRLAGERAARQDAQRSQDIARRHAERADQLRQTAERNLYLAQIRLAQEDWNVNETSRLHMILDRYIPQRGQPDLRGWEWYYLLSLCHTDVRTLRGHTSFLNVVTWSPDSRRVAAGGTDNTVCIWDAATGKELMELNGLCSKITALAWSPDGNKLATGGEEETVHIFDVVTGKSVLNLRGHATNTQAVTWSPDGRQLATGSDDSTVRVWDAMTGAQLLTLHANSDKIIAVAWNPDGVRLAAGSQSGTVILWNVQTAQKVGGFKGAEKLDELAWKPDGRQLAIADEGKRVRFWDTISGKEVFCLSENGMGSLCLAWSPDGRRVVIGGADSLIRIYEARPDAPRTTLKGHNECVWSVAWSPDGTRIASVSGRTIKLWDPEQSQEGNGLPTSLIPFNSALAWSPDGKYIATSSPQDDLIRVWDSTTQEQLCELQGHEGDVFSIDFSPDSSCIASGGDDKTVRIWRLAERRELKCLRGHNGCVCSVAWNPAGTHVGSGSKDETVKIWDIATGKDITTLSKEVSTWVFSVAWSPDGQYLATAPRGHRDTSSWVKVWDASTWEEVFTIRQFRWGGWITGFVDWSPDGQRLASVGPNASIQVWDASDGREVSFLRGHKHRPHVAWHPSSRRLASGSYDDTVRIWGFDSENEVLILPGTGPIAWSPDGLRLASRGLDRTVKIWDASRGYEIAKSKEEYEEDRAYRLVEAGELDEAITILSTLLEATPTNSELRKALAFAHYKRGELTANRGDLNDGMRDCDETVRLYPAYLPALNKLAGYYLARQEFATAAPLLSKKFDIEFDAKKAVTGYRLALAHLAIGNRSAYQSTCTRMLECFGATADAEESRWLAWACALAPDASSDLSAAVLAAERSMQGDPTSIDCINGRVGVFYRTGQFERVVDQLKEVTDWSQQANARSQVSSLYALYFLAMASQQLGRTEEAEKRYREAMECTQQIMHGSGVGGASLTWDESIILELLRDEATGMLRGR